MTKLFAVLFSVLLLDTTADARPLRCRFHSSGKCKNPSYFNIELKNGCATPGTRCRRRFCKANCIDAKKSVRGLCKRGCLDTRTLSSLNRRERQGLYKTVLGLSSNPSQKEVRRALRAEQRLFGYRAKRSRGWFSWFRKQPSYSENLESLVLEGQLKAQYEALIRTENQTGNKKDTVLALRAAAADIVPDPQEFRRKKLASKVLKKWRARVAAKRERTVKELARNAGVDRRTAAEAASQAKRDAVRGQKPPVKPKPARLRRLSSSHKNAIKEESRPSTPDSGFDSGRSTPAGNIPPAPPLPPYLGGKPAANIPPPPPMPPAGFIPAGKPVTPVGTVEDGATSAGVIPPASSVGKGRAALFADINKGGFKLRSAASNRDKPKSSDRPAFLAGIESRPKLRKVSDEQKNQYGKDHKSKPVSGVGAALLNANIPYRPEEESEAGSEWDD